MGEWEEITEKVVALKFAPANLWVEGRIVPMTDGLARRVSSEWWSHEALKPTFDPEPIDRHWDWSDVVIEQHGTVLRSRKLAMITAGDEAVQGAMLVSTDPCPSGLVGGDQCLFVELLFTAPWNRPALRTDGLEFYKGVGHHLLTHAAGLSRAAGFGGRLRLDGSPDFLWWYHARGLTYLDEPSVVHENVSYTSMELTPEAAAKLLAPPTRR